MHADQSKIRKALNAFNFTALREELGWNILKESALSLVIDDRTFVLKPIGHKQGLRLLLCENTDGSPAIPDLKLRLRIDREVAKLSQERILVFVDTDHTRQIWMWVKQDNGVLRPRSFTWAKSRMNDDLIQRLAELYVNINEEGTLSITDIAQRTRSAFDVEKVTKNFYKLFEERHNDFLTQIEGIIDKENRKWYTSLTLNRLMFLYFIQRKGFLAGDLNYLRKKLEHIKKTYTPGVQGFYDFYNKFLLVLFHDGLSKPNYPRSIKDLIGDVPYLNGGLFDVHQLELANPSIRIPDSAFERLFDFFDSYQWHLDDRPTKADNEINPDVLGYIFEKYINRKQMGAYYTKEDITEYISKNTIIPAVFDRAASVTAAKPSFATDGWVWDVLKRDPDAYIYESVRHRVDQDLPEDIACGLHDVQQRTLWNKPAAEEFALPSETWREYIARRQRYSHIRSEIDSGVVTSINDLITYNLDIVSFTRDVIALCDHAPTLCALYTALESLSVLDPTCGSGAFLFAALNILQPLYDQCLNRMQELLINPLDSESYAFFSAVLARMNNRHKHPNKQYFILKTIILQNLYGVDIMDEAVEICKLRLFLKLVAQAESVKQVEPLPDIDFNIRTGNTLVGFARYAEIESLLVSKLDTSNKKEIILTQSKSTNSAYHNFRDAQTSDDLNMQHTAEYKAKLRTELYELNRILNNYLAEEYGVNVSKPDDFSAWLSAHKPFHWFVEFYSIIEDNGGFDVIIGNPPYVEYSKVKDDYTIHRYRTESCGNLYAYIIERALNLEINHGYIGLIVPLSSICTERTKFLQEIISSSGKIWNSSFDTIPGRLFGKEVEQRLNIFIQNKSKEKIVFSSGYRRFIPPQRDYLFYNMSYINLDGFYNLSWIPRIHTTYERNILSKMGFNRIGFYRKKFGKSIYVHRIIGYYTKAFNFIPYFKNDRDGIKKSDDYKVFVFDEEYVNIVLSIINSNLFYWYWHIHSDGFHCGYKDVDMFPLKIEDMSNDIRNRLINIAELLMKDLYNNSEVKVRVFKATGKAELQEFSVASSKPIIDDIDRILAQHYGFTDEELDFIINYDIKYRIGKDSEEE